MPYIDYHDGRRLQTSDEVYEIRPGVFKDPDQYLPHPPYTAGIRVRMVAGFGRDPNEIGAHPNHSDHAVIIADRDQLPGEWFVRGIKRCYLRRVE